MNEGWVEILNNNRTCYTTVHTKKKKRKFGNVVAPLVQNSDLARDFHNDFW